MPKQKALQTALKVVVTVSLLGWLVVTVTRQGASLPDFRTLRWHWLFVVLFLHLIAVCVGTLRWWVLLRAQNLNMTYRQCLRAFFVGRFFGAFTPSTVGLDGYRLAEAGRISGNLAASGSVIFAEKIAGLAGMSLISLLSMTWLQKGAAAFRFSAWLTFAAVAIAGTLLLRAPHFVIRPIVMVVGKLSSKIAARISAIEAKVIPLSWSALFAAVLLGATTHLALASTFAAAGCALWVNAAFLSMVGCGNLIQLGVLAPVSVGGIGVRETVAVAAFGSLGLEASTAVVIALISYLLGQVPALLGGLVYGAKSISSKNSKEDVDSKQ